MKKSSKKGSKAVMEQKNKVESDKDDRDWKISAKKGSKKLSKPTKYPLPNKPAHQSEILDLDAEESTEQQSSLNIRKSKTYKTMEDPE